MTSILEPAGQGPHFDARHQPHGDEQRQGGRAPIADKGQGQADDGADIQRHGHVDHGLDHQHPGDAHGDIGGHVAAGPAGHPHAAQDNEQQHQQHRAAADHAELLPAHSEDVVGMPGGQGLPAGGVGAGAVEIAHAGDLARADGRQGLVLLPAMAPWI